MRPSHRILVGLAAVLSTAAVRAQGIPVIDAANLVQTIQQVTNDLTKINNQVQQIAQLQSQLASMNGMRNLGNVNDNPLLRNYVPAEVFHVVDAVRARGLRRRLPRCGRPAALRLSRHSPPRRQLSV